MGKHPQVDSEKVWSACLDAQADKSLLGPHAILYEILCPASYISIKALPIGTHTVCVSEEMRNYQQLLVENNTPMSPDSAVDMPEF